MEGIVETTLGNVGIPVSNKVNVDATEAVFSTRKPRQDKTTGIDNTDLTQSAIHAAQTMNFPYDAVPSTIPLFVARTRTY